MRIVTHLKKLLLATVLLAAFLNAPAIPARAAAPDPTVITDYQGTHTVTVNRDKVYFGEEFLTSITGEYYPELDQLGRCGSCMALVGPETMPTEPRGMIGMIRPSGWHTVRYDFIDDSFLYNRCHLIGYQLTGENDNPRNLITGTRYMNLNMEPYESRIAQYIQRAGEHVLYRVTPVFEGSNLVAKGVLLEAKSIESDGLEFCVFCYNVQPGVEINYANGDSWPAGTQPQSQQELSQSEPVFIPFEPAAELQSTASEDHAIERAPVQSASTYIGNKNTKKFHYADCASVGKMAAHNKNVFPEGTTREDIIGMGYDPCRNCKP